MRAPVGEHEHGAAKALSMRDEGAQRWHRRRKMEEPNEGAADAKEEGATQRHRSTGRGNRHLRTSARRDRQDGDARWEPDRCQV